MRHAPPSPLPLPLVAVLLAASMVGGIPSWAASAPERRARAVSLYDQGRCAEALPILHSLVTDGEARGSDHYRVFYCERAAGNRSAEREALGRALTLLESENETATDLETPFYFSNALRNAARDAEAREVAARATAKIDSGARPEPGPGIERFQLAKLYEDQGKADGASRWYRSWLETLASGATDYPNHVRWARRYLGRRALANAEFESAEREFAALAASDLANRDDYGILARACARQARWTQAADAWSTMLRLDPGRGDDARYSAQLARVAATLGALPDRAPSGRSWDQMARHELETLMAEQAGELHRIRQAAAETAASEEREDLARQVQAVRRVFVAAALDYALKGLPIRETAFGGGYAPLIFQSGLWDLPPATPNQDD